MPTLSSISFFDEVEGGALVGVEVRSTAGPCWFAGCGPVQRKFP